MPDSIQDASPLIGLGQVRYILKSVANGDDQSAVATKAVEIIDEAAALLKQYEEALEEFVAARDEWLESVEGSRSEDRAAERMDEAHEKARAALKAGQS